MSLSYEQKVSVLICAKREVTRARESRLLCYVTCVSYCLAGN